MLGQQLLDQPAQKRRLDQPALAQGGQRVVHQALQARVLDHPDAEGQAEALLLLGQDFVGQESAQRLLEEPAQFLALELVVGRQAHREGQQGIVEHREAHR